MPRMTLDLSDEIDQALTDIATQGGITKAEAMRRAFALLAVAYAEKKPASRWASSGNVTITPSKRSAAWSGSNPPDLKRKERHAKPWPDLCRTGKDPRRNR